MIAMPSCAIVSFLPRAVSGLVPTSFMHSSYLKNSNSEGISFVLLLTTIKVKMPQFGWQLHDDQPHGASAPCSISITLGAAEYELNGNQSRSGSSTPPS